MQQQQLGQQRKRCGGVGVSSWTMQRGPWWSRGGMRRDTVWNSCCCSSAGGFGRVSATSYMAASVRVEQRISPWLWGRVLGQAAGGRRRCRGSPVLCHYGVRVGGWWGGKFFGWNGWASGAYGRWWWGRGGLRIAPWDWIPAVDTVQSPRPFVPLRTLYQYSVNSIS